jgi:hypothetical protein
MNLGWWLYVRFVHFGCVANSRPSTVDVDLQGVEPMRLLSAHAVPVLKILCSTLHMSYILMFNLRTCWVARNSESQFKSNYESLKVFKS